ncbi:MAG: hypothetical protein Q4P13_10710, partial [Psychrobacter sp.]|nr:hypothetical protein [Psychrobacter sp.]
MALERLMRFYDLEFCVAPGWVVSKNDGQRHWVSQRDLIQLYDIPRDLVSDQPMKGGKNIIKLRPQYSGEYDLQSEVMEYLSYRFGPTKSNR